mmetsp:Transcript_53267/g.105896  ORF Transcript_53267/g.105896 Transcript_53267/m.105896 type:complete len:202 (-) Transcript_53267:370-975(-)
MELVLSEDPLCYLSLPNILTNCFFVRHHSILSGKDKAVKAIPDGLANLHHSKNLIEQNNGAYHIMRCESTIHDHVVCQPDLNQKGVKANYQSQRRLDEKDNPFDIFCFWWLIPNEIKDVVQQLLWRDKLEHLNCTKARQIRNCEPSQMSRGLPLRETSVAEDYHNVLDSETKWNEQNAEFQRGENLLWCPKMESKLASNRG